MKKINNFQIFSKIFLKHKKKQSLKLQFFFYKIIPSLEKFKPHLIY
jgi:hypothetical protein